MSDHFMRKLGDCRLSQYGVEIGDRWTVEVTKGQNPTDFYRLLNAPQYRIVAELKLLSYLCHASTFGYTVQTLKLIRSICANILEY